MSAIPRQWPPPSLCPAVLPSALRSQGAGQGWLWWSIRDLEEQNMMESNDKNSNNERITWEPRLYFDDLFQTVELWRKGHATDQECSSHVMEAHHHLLGLSLYLNGQLPGGCQDEGHRTCCTLCFFLKVNKQQLTLGCVEHNLPLFGLIFLICKEWIINIQ